MGETALAFQIRQESYWPQEDDGRHVPGVTVLSVTQQWRLARHAVLTRKTALHGRQSWLTKGQVEVDSCGKKIAFLVEVRPARGSDFFHSRRDFPIADRRAWTWPSFVAAPAARL